MAIDESEFQQNRTMNDRPIGAGIVEALFNPQSIAFIGASDNPKKLGSVALRNLRAGGYEGRIYPISRRLEYIDGLRCYASPRVLPEPVDVAFLTIPADVTPDMVRECASAGVKVVILGSAGFAESGPEGARLQEELVTIAQQEGIRIVGPNCNGIYRSSSRVALGFNTAHSRALRKGNVAIISHSGALFESMASRLSSYGAGLSMFVSTGNEVDLDLLDYLEYAVEDADSAVVALLLDRISDAMRFRRVAALAKRSGKHVVVLKIGHSELGNVVAAAHSSRLASNSQSYQALFEQAGIPTVSTIEALMGSAALLSKFGKVDGGVAAFSTSGAGASLFADLAERYGVPLAAFSEQLQQRISFEQPNALIGNPTDIGVYGGIARSVPSVIAADNSVGVAAAMMHSMLPSQRQPLLDIMQEARIGSKKPFIAFNPGIFSDEERTDYLSRGFAVIGDTDAAMQSLAAMVGTRNDDEVALRKVEGREMKPGLIEGDFQLSEPDSLDILARYGLPTVQTIRCRCIEEAVASAKEVGWPVVLKGVVDGIGHKTEHGLVQINLADEQALHSAYSKMGKPQNVIVQPMIKDGLEVILGISRAPDTGLMLLAGLGGIYVDAIKDIVMWPIPTTENELRRKLNASSLGRVLQSPRWVGKNSFESLVSMLIKMENFAIDAGDNLEALDINPVLVLPDQVIAVDALIIRRNDS